MSICHSRGSEPGQGSPKCTATLVSSSDFGKRQEESSTCFSLLHSPSRIQYPNNVVSDTLQSQRSGSVGWMAMYVFHHTQSELESYFPIMTGVLVAKWQTPQWSLCGRTAMAVSPSLSVKQQGKLCLLSTRALRGLPLLKLL